MHFFPTVSLSYALDDDDTMLASLSYTRGIQYMPFNEISSTVDSCQEYSYTRGNPDLSPGRLQCRTVFRNDQKNGISTITTNIFPT